MADGQITILPPSQLQAPNQVAQGSTSHPNTVLASQPAGTVLQGFIINRDASGNPIVRTDKGDIPFSTNFFLKIGSEVVIRVGNTGGNSFAQLVSVDGQSPEEAQNQSAFAQDPEVILSPQLSQSLTSTPLTTSTVAAQQAPTGTTTITLTGTVVAQPQSVQDQSPLVQQPVVSNGTQLTVKLMSISNSLNATPTEIPETSVVTPGSTASQATSAFYATYARAAGATPTPQEITASSTQAPETSPVTQTSVTQTPIASAAPPPATTAPASLPAQIGAPAAATPAITTVSAANVTVAQQPGTPVIVTSQSSGTSPSIPNAQAPVTPTPPQATVPPAPDNVLQPGTNVTGTVIGSDVLGETLVQSPLGIVRLQTGSTIPSGSTVTFQVLQSTPPVVQNVPTESFASQQPAPITELAQQWSSLQQIFSLLAGRSTLTEPEEPATPLSILTTPDSNNVQTPGANVTAQTITSGLFSFISSLRSGDFQNWLGTANIRTLQDQGQEDLLKKAQMEFSDMARQFTQTPLNHWQSLFFPLASDGTSQQVRIFVKRDRKQGNQQGKGNKEEDTRFVIEVGLSQLGELQMDGFVRRQENSMQFDMVIRSLSGLPSEIQNDIFRIYNDMGAITGYSGSVTFQSVKAFPVNPMQEIAAAHSAVTA